MTPDTIDWRWLGDPRAWLILATFGWLCWLWHRHWLARWKRRSNGGD
jgi:hypothetical protein